MTFHKAISRRFLFSAIFVGLNVLCFMGMIHGRHVMRHARVNYSHISPSGMGRAGSRRVYSADCLIDHAFQAHETHRASTGPHLISPVSLVAAAGLLRPTFLTKLIVRENLVALGSAPRGPGLGRAPPVI